MTGPTKRLRVGCDITALAPVAQSIERFGDRYLRRLFTANELRDCDGADRIPRLAARFAAKEATIKAFAEPDAAYPPRSIEVTLDAGLPWLVLHGDVAQLAQRQGWREVSLSLSHDDCHAMAMVAVLCE